MYCLTIEHLVPAVTPVNLFSLAVQKAVKRMACGRGAFLFLGTEDESQLSSTIGSIHTVFV